MILFGAVISSPMQMYKRVLGQLRSKQIRQPGEVKNLFFEANGNLTIVRAIEPTAGLCVLPDDDITFVSELKCAAREVCHVCGAARNGGQVPELRQDTLGRRRRMMLLYATIRFNPTTTVPQGGTDIVVEGAISPGTLLSSA